MSEWMPIETAPKDGTRIIAYFPNDDYPVLTVVWSAFYREWRLEPDGGSEFVYDVVGAPTHWMPIHQPPEESP